MVSRIIKVNPKKPAKRCIQKAAEIIKKGGLVAFPTETVYGLAGNVFDKKAIKKIFKVKKRPLDNPIIVHIAELSEIFKLAKKIPPKTKILAKKFWPGPLTLVLFKKKEVPKEVTAQSDSVAIRMPKNKIALELIRKANCPLAAPSANLAGRPSPTSAEDVFEDLGDKIDLILDGGKTEIGLESTVLDLTVQPAQILRPGGISFEDLKKVIPEIQLHPSLKRKVLRAKDIKKKVKSPGIKYRHYAPKAPLILFEDEKKVAKIQKLIKFYQSKNKKVGVMAFKETKKFYQKADIVLSIGSKRDLKRIAKNLFKTLREFDKRGVDIILAEGLFQKGLSQKGIGFAIEHRLRKAAKIKK